MDIQRERVAFEAYEFARRPFASKKVMFQRYDPARIGDCDGNEGRYYDVQTQEKWEIWLHVKSQAVPDGFVLINKECSDEMAEVIAGVARVCGGGADDIYDAVVNQAMIEVGGGEKGK